MKLDFNLKSCANQIIAKMTSRARVRSLPARAIAAPPSPLHASQADEWMPTEKQVRNAARSVWGPQVAAMDDAELIAHVIEAGCADLIGLTDDYFKRPEAHGAERAAQSHTRQTFAKAMQKAGAVKP